nr:hypothetical protein 1 [Rhodospirillaceae bacterium]
MPLFDRQPDDQFFLDGGDNLISSQEAVNVGIVNLWRSIEMQSHGQAWAVGLPAEDLLELGPNRAVTLPEGGSFGFAAPHTPVAETLDAIDYLIRQTAITHNLPGRIFDRDTKAESATAKMIEHRDLLEARREDLELWRVYEHRLFELIKRVVNTHVPGTIPAEAHLRVDFGEIEETISEGQRLEGYQRRLMMGVWSPIDVLLALNPDLRGDREAAARILQERRQESALFAPDDLFPNFGSASSV